MKKRLKKKKKN